MELRVAELRRGVVLGMSDRGELTNADLVVLWDSGTKSFFGVSNGDLCYMIETGHGLPLKSEGSKQVSKTQTIFLILTSHFLLVRLINVWELHENP